MSDSSSESYVHGYQSASQSMARRTAEREAAFFLPLLKSGMNLLDAGCGPGTITLGLAEYLEPGHVTGFDIGPSEIEKATTSASEQNVSNIEFHVLDATKIPFEDDQFDAVFSSAMLEHVPNVGQAVDELVRVLRPGGVIGLRGGYVPGVLSGPDTEATTRYRDILAALWSSRGGDPEFGLKQAELLHTRGFQEISQTAWYETRVDGTANAADRLAEQSYIDGVEKAGVATRQELEQLTVAMKKNSEHPLAFTHISWIQVTARKPV